MKVKDLIKELEYFYLQDEDIDILGYLHDEDSGVVYIYVKYVLRVMLSQH